MKKITFKSSIHSFEIKNGKKEHISEEKNVIEFTTRLLDFEEENGLKCFTFEEVREGKKIMNRIEYNNDTLKIFSGVSSVTCKLDEVVKNDFVVNNEIGSFFIYTKMYKLDIENENDIHFYYYVCSSDDFEHGNDVNINLKIKD